MTKRFILLLLTVLLTAIGYAQNRTVTGTVRSADDGETLLGAVVRIKGAEGGAVTDVNGQFTVSMPADKNTLTISYNGFVAQDVKTSDTAKSLNVRLRRDNKGLNEVVVVGYGTVRRRDLTGSVSS